jgi:hypothetical protein
MFAALQAAGFRLTNTDANGFRDMAARIDCGPRGGWLDAESQEDFFGYWSVRLCGAQEYERYTNENNPDKFTEWLQECITQSVDGPQ